MYKYICIIIRGFVSSLYCMPSPQIYKGGTLHRIRFHKIDCPAHLPSLKPSGRINLTPEQQSLREDSVQTVRHPGRDYCTIDRSCLKAGIISLANTRSVYQM